jgi:hypothetical protein
MLDQARKDEFSMHVGLSNTSHELCVWEKGKKANVRTKIMQKSYTSAKCSNALVTHAE